MTIFAFEEATRDLPNPTISAQRALAHSGLNMPLAIWRTLPIETRHALIQAGAADRVDVGGVRAGLRSVTLKLQMVSPLGDPPTNRLPHDLDAVLGPWRPLVAYHWPSTRGLHRWVLAALATNPRLLWRAMSEIGSFDRWNGSSALPPIHGMLARCSVRMSSHAFRALLDPRFHAGKAGVLARAAGVRAARWTPDVVDAQAEGSVGPIELEWGQHPQGIGVLWQAHVSSAQGVFSRTASLLAATTAGVALIDLLVDVDPTAHIAGAEIQDEPWMFGNEDSGESTLAV